MTMLKAGGIPALLATLLTAAALPSTAQSLVGATQGPAAALYSIDAATGATTQIGGALPADAQISALTQSGSSLIAGTLGGNLYQIDPLTGASSLLGSVGNTNPFYGLATFNGALYGLQNDAADASIENLYRIDLGTAVSETDIAQINGTDLLAGRGLTVYNNNLVTPRAAVRTSADCGSAQSPRSPPCRKRVRKSPWPSAWRSWRVWSAYAERAVKHLRH
jgi:hypothetical protein